MPYFSWKPYVPVAKRRQQAAQKIAKLRKQGQSIESVVLDGRTIARSFWGKAWCDNLERYSDYANRLPRGRTYVRNGSVIDLQITGGRVTALVSGSEIYQVRITVAAVPTAHWQALCRDCAGTIDSLVELLQGRLFKGVMERVCRPGSGLFPSPKDITLTCSCPDWAEMCKHVAAVLYGVGARLDAKPELLFKLRQVDETELIARAGKDIPLAKKAPKSAKLLDEGDLAALFGVEMSETVVPEGAASRHRKPARAAAPKAAPAKPTVTRKKTATARPAKSATATQAKQTPLASKRAVAKKAVKRNKAASTGNLKSIGAASVKKPLPVAKQASTKKIETRNNVLKADTKTSSRAALAPDMPAHKSIKPVQGSRGRRRG